MSIATLCCPVTRTLKHLVAAGRGTADTWPLLCFIMKGNEPPAGGAQRGAVLAVSGLSHREHCCFLPTHACPGTPPDQKVYSCAAKSGKKKGVNSLVARSFPTPEEPVCCAGHFSANINHLYLFSKAFGFTRQKVMEGPLM